MTDKTPFYEALKVGVDEVVDEMNTAKTPVKQMIREKERYETLVENSLTGIYIDQDGKIVFANDQFARIYRYPKEELMGMRSRDLVHPSDRELTDKMRANRLEGKDPKAEYDARGITKDGETIWVRRRNTQITYGDKPAILGNVVDITEQKETQKALENANEELNDLIHVITHDINTPVIAIHGFSERLLKKFKDRLDEKAKSYLDQILECSKRVNSLVEDLRELSKTGEVSPEFDEVSSQEIVENVKQLFQEMIRKKQIEIEAVTELPAIRCDRNDMYRVFENLTGNAIKYMGNKEGSRIEIGYEDKGTFHQFYLKDNGVGIDPKDQAKIFRKFYRLKEAKDKKGTGLGLVIVKRIVENHGGRVWVESEKDEGATFFFTLAKSPEKS